jgi:hypothetical protein
MADSGEAVEGEEGRCEVEMGVALEDAGADGGEAEVDVDSVPAGGDEEGGAPGADGEAQGRIVCADHEVDRGARASGDLRDLVAELGAREGAGLQIQV